MKYIWGALAALVVGGCDVGGKLNGPTPLLDDGFIGGNRVSPLGGAPQSVAVGTLIDHFYLTAQLARAPDAGPDIQLAAFNSGAAVINARCQIYFRGLGLDARNLSFAQSQITLLTGGLTTILALVGAAQVAVASVAAGSTALLTGMKQFGDAYYFSADPTAVEQLVVKAQGDVLNKVNQDGNGPADFPSMISMLVSYQTICQPHTIKHLINVAVSNSTPIAQFAGPSLDKPPLMGLVTAKMAQDLGVSTLTEGQIAIIAAAFDANAFSQPNFKFVCGYVARFLNGSFVLPAGTAIGADGSCPQGVVLSPDAIEARKRASFIATYATLISTYPDYFRELRQKVGAAKTDADLAAIAGTATRSNAQPMFNSMSGRTMSGNVQPARGRVGGFVINVK